MKAIYAGVTSSVACENDANYVINRHQFQAVPHVNKILKISPFCRLRHAVGMAVEHTGRAILHQLGYQLMRVDRYTAFVCFLIQTETLLRTNISRIPLCLSPGNYSGMQANGRTSLKHQGNCPARLETLFIFYN